MILSSIYANDDMRIYPSAVQEAIEYLKKTDFAAMEAGRYEIKGDDMYALLMDIETAPAEKKRPEAHRDYLDVQFVVSGAEKQGYAPLKGGEEIVEAKPEKDIWFYAAPELESFVFVPAGAFTVYYPSDLHRPGCAIDVPAKVRKVVVKIKMSALNG